MIREPTEWQQLNITVRDGKTFALTDAGETVAEVEMRRRRGKWQLCISTKFAIEPKASTCENPT